MTNRTYNFIDLTGQVFEKLTVLYRDGNRGSRWICQCVCRNIKSYQSQKLRLGKIKSCGCFHDRHLSESKTTHGMRDTPEYKSWNHLKDRCNNVNNRDYGRYGGRGISVYEPWLTDFSLFFIEVGPRPGPDYSIDRIDNTNGNYEPGNVRWSTKKTQNRNRRDNVHLISNQGRILLLCEWAEELSMRYSTIRKLLKNGWFIL